MFAFSAVAAMVLLLLLLFLADAIGATHEIRENNVKDTNNLRLSYDDTYVNEPPELLTTAP